MKLTNGRRAVHRALLHSYRKQAMRNNLQQQQQEQLREQAKKAQLQNPIFSNPKLMDIQRRADRRREAVEDRFKLKIGISGNNQKHFRDHLLQ